MSDEAAARGQPLGLQSVLACSRRPESLVERVQHTENRSQAGILGPGKARHGEGNAVHGPLRTRHACLQRPSGLNSLSVTIRVATIHINLHGCK